ncbi:Flavin reductase-like protein [Rhodotorula toruloides]|nr:Flavin reductase-like protein [Rhodotorula toruloides]
MLPRTRTPLRPWLARAQTTVSSGSLPSPLQRELFRRVAQPVAVVTARIPSSDGEVDGATARTGQKGRHNHGATLSSLASISLSPPLVSFSLRLPSRLATFLSSPSSPDALSTSPFRVHLLSTSQEPLARAFARQAPLPAPAQPSPPPSSQPSGQSWDSLPAFEPALFDELEKTSLGWMDCKVVKRIPLSELGEDGPTSTGRGKDDSQQPRSELFIARVEQVSLGQAKEGSGSLMYWEQQYAQVEPLDGKGR